MPASPKFDPHEAPTEPERSVECPECHGAGELALDGGDKQGCGVCWGKRQITAHDLVSYLLRRGE